MRNARATAGEASLRQLKFVTEYLVDLNATQAAIRAGYKPSAAFVTGCRLLKHVKVKAALQAAQARLAAVGDVSRERWLLEIKRLAFYDPRKLYDTHGNPIEIPLLGDDEAAAVIGFEFTEDYLNAKSPDGDTKRVASGYTKKLRLADKLKALEFYGKAVGYYVEKKELMGSLTLEQLVTGQYDAPSSSLSGRA